MKKRTPLVIGLTGSIGMGKSTTLILFHKRGVRTFSADQTVHDLLGEGGRAVKKVARLFPEALKNKAIDRKIVGQSVFLNPAKLKKLEKILHPMVRQEERKRIAEAKKGKEPFIVLDIPLLFETGGEKRCDVVVCVSANAKTQRARVLKRPNMTLQKLRAIQKNQLSNAEKKRKADFVVQTDKGLVFARQQVRAILNCLSADL